MPSVLLWAYSAEELFLISRLSRSAERSKRLFTGGVVTENGICSAAFCESAALGEDAAGLRPHPALRATFPRPGEGFSGGGHFLIAPNTLAQA